MMDYCSVLHASIVLLHLAIGSYGAVHLSFERSAMSNEITLRCRDGANFHPLPNPDFWLNSTAMPLTSLLATSEYIIPDVGKFRFTITQDLEGEYYCGYIGTSSSSPEVLITYPQPEANTSSYYAVQTGDSVTLPCAIKPGALQQYYSVQWMNGQEPLTHSGGHLSDRYGLKSDFTLAINSVELNDSGVRYHCVVTVDNPLVSGTVNYYVAGPQTTLYVYDIPHITSPPEDRVLLDGQSTEVTFTCLAEGFPTVTIAWFHQGQNVMEREDSGRFQTEIIPSADGITSQLVIRQIKEEDNGTYMCCACNTVDTGEEDIQFCDTQSATLSVLNTGVLVTLPPETVPESESNCTVSDSTIIIASAAIGGGLVAIALLVISAVVFCKILNFFTHEAQIDKLLQQVERYKDDPVTKTRLLDILEKRIDSNGRESSCGHYDAEPPVNVQNSVPPPDGNDIEGTDGNDIEGTDDGYLQQVPCPGLTPDDMTETQFDSSSGANTPVDKQPYTMEGEESTSSHDS